MQNGLQRVEKLPWRNGHYEYTKGGLKVAYYEFECGECGTITEMEFPIRDSPQDVPCRECGKPAKKIISSCSFRLKGEGWPSLDMKKGIWDN
jgi:putative FmdB family regulatory protein